MNLLGEFVTHKAFGRGQIVEISEGSVTVLFESSNEKKKFIYPSSVGTFLVLENKKAAKQMQDYKNERIQTKALEQKQAEDKIQEEKLALENPKKTVKKRSPKSK